MPCRPTSSPRLGLRVRAASLALALLASTHAWAQAVDEDAMFGGPEPADAPAPATATTGPADLTADSTQDEAGLFDRAAEGLSARMSAREDFLDIGGLLYLRGSYSLVENVPGKHNALSTPSLVDLYADVRPTERVRAFVRGRVNHNFAVRDGSRDAYGNVQDKTTVQLDQLWAKFDIARTVYVTGGKQPLRWGSGRFWNPTDFVNTQVRDPLAAFDVRLGVGMLKLHLPVESKNMNFYAIGTLDEANTPEEIGGALRGEFVLGTAELSLSAAARKDQPYILGADISAGIWDFDLRLEGAVHYRDRGKYYTGTINPFTGEMPVLEDRSQDWIPQLVAGLDYAFNVGDNDSVSLGVEYFWNESGYDGASIYPWLLAQGAFRPLYLGQHYGGAYVLAMGPGSWDDTTWIGSVLGNLSDKSYLARLDFRATLLSYLSLDTYVNYHFGKSGEFHYGLSVPPIPGYLPKGIEINQPIADFGIGLRVAL